MNTPTTAETTPGSFSALDVCNVALSKLGEAPIEAISPNLSSASRLCHLHYHPARRESLTLARWSFATKEINLTCDPQPILEHSKYPYHFTLPMDCLRVMTVECRDWTMQGKKIRATSSELPMTYIADIEDTTLFDPLFTEALATHLAEKLAVPLTGNQALRQNLAREFHQVILPLAATTNAVQSHSNDAYPLLSLLRARMFGDNNNCE
ncbi:MAG: hypothetical protein RR719_00845 [Akkermansia sp.]